MNTRNRTYICFGGTTLLKVNGAGFSPIAAENENEARTTAAGALRIKRYCKRVGMTFRRVDVTAA